MDIFQSWNDDEEEIETEINKEPNEEEKAEWQKEWVGMPEFSQERQKPYAMIKVRFDNEEDLQEFAKLIGQKLTNKTKSIWHPQLVRGKHSHLKWVDEDES